MVPGTNYQLAQWAADRTTATVDQDGKMIEDVQSAVKQQAKRTVTVAQWVKKGINDTLWTYISLLRVINYSAG